MIKLDEKGEAHKMRGKQNTNFTHKTSREETA
jgi:hypothetical protein